MVTSAKEPVPVSSLESNKLTLEIAEFSLSSAIREATRDVAPLATGHQATVCCLLEPSLPDHVLGDAASLKTVVVALLSAAIESAGAGEVKLSVFPSGHSDLTLELTFEATSSTYAPGIPLSPQHADPISSDGNLQPARQRVEALGGELGVHLQQGMAPVFWCRIPVQQPAIRHRGQAKEHSTHPDTTPARNSTVRILMAEDNSINQRVGKLILQRAGFCIDLVTDGNEAVEAHRSEPYDMILMDCQMPTMDGFEATRRIRAGSQRQPVIIAVTANALVGERERCLAAGMDDYLSKPFQAEQLVAIVEKWASSASKR